MFLPNNQYVAATRARTNRHGSPAFLAGAGGGAGELIVEHQEKSGNRGGAKLSRCQRFKGEVGYHGIKITVIMEQVQPFNNTERRDNYINCFSYRNTGFSKASVILSTLDGDLVSADLPKREGAKKAFGSFVILIGSETLKDFSENQISNDDRNFRKISVKRVCLPGGNTVEITDPYG